jgi:hypothetical protein
MVNAKEHRSDEAHSYEKGNRVKVSKAYSLRAAQDVARYGKAARHPLCQAALELWRMDDDLPGLMKQNAEVVELVCKARQQKKQAQALVEQFRTEGKASEAKEATALLCNIDRHLLKTQQCLQSITKGISVHLKLHGMSVRRFGWEYGSAGADALKALPRVRQRWEALNDGAWPKEGDARELGLLQLLRDKKIKAEWAKGGAIAGYWEAATGGDRLLSGEVWSGRLTVQEIRSHLEATYGHGVAGDKEGKEIRRTLKTLGIRPAEDQRGRKLKGPRPGKQKPQQPLGRPRKGPDLEFVADTDIVQVYHARKGKTQPRGSKTLVGGNDMLAEVDQELTEVEVARIREQAEIEAFQLRDREIELELAKLKRQQKKLGKKPMKPLASKPEGLVKGRSTTFASFLDCQQ